MLHRLPGGNPVYITEDEVRAVLSYQALIPAIREALVDYSSGLVDQPARMMLRAGNAGGHLNGWFAVMPVVAGDVMAVKTVTFYPGNAEKGLHTHMAVIELLRRSTGEPLAIMDGRLITEMRTAAVSAVVLATLSPPWVSSLGILGSGVQARSHIQAFRMVRGFKDIRIWSRNPAHAQQLAEQTGARAVPIEEAAGADVVLTVTASPQPVLEGRWLSPHALVLAIGATGASLRELDDEVMRTSFVVAESRSCVERESGDVRLSGAKVGAEIGEILSGSVAAPSNGRIVFKSVGMAIEDLTAARLVWQAHSFTGK
jgi:ornithine cyclodeaminase/alanine dehydrogenase-like protein (mu-crystallin family)